MSSVSVTRKTTIAVKADEISKILRAHFQVTDDAWVEYHFLDYGDTLDRAEISWTVTDEIDQTPSPQPNSMGDLSRSDPSRDSTFVILEKDTREGASDFRPVVALVPVGDQGLQLRGDFEPVDIDLSGLSRRIGLEAGNFDYCLGVRRGEAIGLVRNVHFRSVSSEDAE